MSAPPLVVAVARGRILREALPLLARAGIGPAGDAAESRRLLFDTAMDGVRLMVMRGPDVPTCVEFGAAALGVVGRDVILEHGGEGFYEPLDLRIARCRLMTARPAGAARPAGGRLRVATKYTAVAKRHFAGQGRQVELIRLTGALELAPAMGLADAIVDIVDTGGTLRANGLEPEELVADVSARVIANKAAMKIRHGEVMDILARLRRAVKDGPA